MSDHWFYRTLGQELGPVSLETIQELIRAEVLGRGDDFRQDDGPWHDFSELLFLINSSEEPDRQIEEGRFDNQFPPGLIGRTVSSHPPSVAQRIDPQESGPDHSPITQALIECRKQLHDRDAKQVKHRPHETRSVLDVAKVFVVPLTSLFRTIGILGSGLSYLRNRCLPVLSSKFVWGPIFVLLLGGAALIVPAKWTTQDEAYEYLHGTFMEIQTLRERDARADEWAVFTRQTTAELDRLLPKLEQAASADNPASLELLWAARDYLPEILQSAPDQNREAEEKFALHMRAARQLIEPPETSPEENWVVIGIVVADASLLILAALWWRRSTRLNH